MVSRALYGVDWGQFDNGVGEPMLIPSDYGDALFCIIVRITGPLLLLRSVVSRVTAVSLLSAFGWKGRLSVTSVLERGRDATP